MAPFGVIKIIKQLTIDVPYIPTPLVHHIPGDKRCILPFFCVSSQHLLVVVSQNNPFNSHQNLSSRRDKERKREGDISLVICRLPPADNE
jgi:hypothetical protein